jgi:hypothetical protein
MAEQPSERDNRSFLRVQKREILDEMSAKVQSRSTGLNPIEYICRTSVFMTLWHTHTSIHNITTKYPKSAKLIIWLVIQKV